MGTVTDVNGEAIPNAAVVLRKVESDEPRTIVTIDNPDVRVSRRDTGQLPIRSVSVPRGCRRLLQTFTIHKPIVVRGWC